MSDPERDPGRMQDESRDLGFGSVASRESGGRLLNRDGTFNVRRHGLGWFTSLSPYQTLLGISWLRFHAFIVVAYLATNVVFAFAYLLCGDDALAGSTAESFGTHFMRAFSFSVETLSTIGYGHLSPDSFAANAFVTPYRDMTAFVFRIVNLRKSEIIELGARVVLSHLEEEADGGTVRRFSP